MQAIEIAQDQGFSFLEANARNFEALGVALQQPDETALKGCDVAIEAYQVAGNRMGISSMLGILAERAFPADEVVALASRRSQGIDVSYGDRTLKCRALEHFDFSDIDICLMSAGSSVSKDWAPRISAAAMLRFRSLPCRGPTRPTASRTERIGQ